MEVDDQLLMALDWCITSKNGRIVEVEPPEDGACACEHLCLCAWFHRLVSPTFPRPHTAAAPADFPKSFTSVAEAVAYLQGRVGFVAPALAEKVINAAANDVVKANQGVGWRAQPPRPLRSAMTDTFLRKASHLIVLRCVFVDTASAGAHACRLLRPIAD